MKKKILGMFILIISYILINFIWSNAVFAVTQTTLTDINSINIGASIKGDGEVDTGDNFY